jgi:hypothetical protein
MVVKSLSDEELINLWEEIAKQIDPNDTQKPSAGLRRLSILGDIHDELISRGYKAHESTWVKANGAGTP